MSKRSLLFALWLAAMVALHQDVWWWTSRHLVFGLIPIGLAWQVLFSVLAAISMWGLVKWCWPHDVERLVEEHERASASASRTEDAP